MTFDFYLESSKKNYNRPVRKEKLVLFICVLQNIPIKSSCRKKFPQMCSCFPFHASVISHDLKGKYHANLLSFQTQKCLSVSRNKKINVKFVIKLLPQCNKNCRLVPLARDRVGGNGLKLEKY